jgi:hypothetical protein
MPGDFAVTGLDDLARLSRALREAGEQGKGLKRELRSGLNKETKKTRADMRKAIAPALPQSGGLAADVLRTTRFSTRIGTGANPSVQIRARGRRSIRRMNATGTFRHPVFGRRDTWVTQYGPRLPRFLDKPFEESRPDLQYAVTQAIARVSSQIYRSV